MLFICNRFHVENRTDLLSESYQISQMSELVLVGVPLHNMVLICLQCQNRCFCGCLLELKEEREHKKKH